jgi:FkbM family methyltransferase
MDIETFFTKHKLIAIGIIHIGAHMCEERDIYLKYGLTDNDIVWIEGNPETFLIAKNTLPKSVKLYQALITNNDTLVDFVVTNNICSSSIYNLKIHLEMHPDVHKIKTIKLPTTTLTNFIKINNLDINCYDFLVMDIQGAEYVALIGMLDILYKFKYVWMEISIVELYENYVTFPVIEEFMKNNNFECIDHVINSHNWGDALFVNKNFNSHG